ncbi:DUF3299 domain-containing protein [Croceibacterium sp. TMG7-5b_MA50]|uniref:DUF3299 domain-containing protein n=1 Tax=Croceibacterium sp. TMG7-5b_MA50 TaxID=3121290 RepID=UPI0032216906
MIRLALIVACAALATGGTLATAQTQRNGLRPSESVWQPARTPPGGTSWALLESTEEDQRTSGGIIYSKPRFPQPVRALGGKRIKVAGYMMPLQNSARQTHFVLLAYPPDCPFHLNPAPDQFIEIRTGAPVAVKNGVAVFEGTLVLTGQDESGVFYQMTNAREV